MTRVMASPERRHGGWVVDQEEEWMPRRRYRRSYGSARRSLAIRSEARKLRRDVMHRPMRFI
jgi:hypothetical protein